MARTVTLTDDDLKEIEDRLNVLARFDDEAEIDGADEVLYVLGIGIERGPEGAVYLTDAKTGDCLVPAAAYVRD